MQNKHSLCHFPSMISYRTAASALEFQLLQHVLKPRYRHDRRRGDEYSGLGIQVSYNFRTNYAVAYIISTSYTWKKQYAHNIV